MKNHWLKNKPVGFPQDDEYSIMQGTGSANLDMYYAMQFMQNETLDCTIYGKFQNTTGFVFQKNNPQYITGTIYYKGIAVQTIFSTEPNNNQFAVKSLPEMKDVFASKIGYLNKANCIIVDWSTDVDHKDVKIIASYEFAIGDQPEESTADRLHLY